MHRFRKKSDAKRSETSAAGIAFALHSEPLPSFSPIVAREVQIDPPLSLPSLPPVDDFRTSLILPDLTKRFTLLRSSSGDPVSLDDLRSRFAQQRARGAENQISEEEEEMLLDMLSRIRAGNAGGSSNSSYVKSEPGSAGYATSEFTQSGGIRSSTQSTSTMGSNTTYEPSYGSTSPSSRASKRHSNNLFAGQFRDLRYMRKPSARMGSARSVLSNSPSESTMGSTTNAVIDSYADGYRPVTPDNSTPSISAASSPSFLGTPTRSTVLSHLSIEDGKLGGLGKLPNAQLKRISVSLKEVIKEIEEEAEDDVVFPRTSISSQQTQQQSPSKVEPEPPKGAVAVTTDDDEENARSAITDVTNEPAALWKADADRPGSATGYRSPSPFRAGGSTSPVPRVPGYIPGMPRPVTPAREMELDDVRSHSTTPRAASPTALLNRTTTSPFAAPATTLLRNASNASSIARPGSPLKNLISQKTSKNGSNDEDHQVNGFSTEFAQPSASAHWRRPSSPLSNNVFSSFSNDSRPSTPSNSNWTFPVKPAGHATKTLGRNGTLLGNNKNRSMTSVSETQDRADFSGSDGIQAASRSPQQAYSPHASLTDEDNLVLRSKFLSNGSSLPMASYDHDDRQMSSSGSDRFARSPTPTHDPARSLPMGSGNDDTPRRNQRVLSPFATPPSSPFALKATSSNPLFISPMSNNSSRSSLVSAGSSYHSWEEENGFSAGFISAVNQADSAWHDVSSKLQEDEPEKILQQFTGLSKGDLLIIQSKLVDAAQTRAKTAEIRSPSTLRRRRPSTAQSIQSYGGVPSRTTSPAPQIANQLTYLRPPDSSAKASALLNSVLDSIDSSEQPIIPKFDANGQFVASNPTESEVASPQLTLPPVDPEPPSPVRRNKDLADIIFGSDSAASSATATEFVSEQAEKTQARELNDNERSLLPDKIIAVQPVAPSTSERTVRQGDIEVSDVSPRSPIAMDPGELIRQVQERTDAAMAQLHRSPRQGVFPSAGSPIIRRKINAHDISGPLNVQSSASIDKLPTVTLPANQSTANLQRSNTSTKLSLSKRLRNTLRSKPNQPNGDEITPWTADNASSSSISRANGNRSLTPSKALGSTSDLKFTNPSPPSSAGPSSLKGFMSRFRKKGQADHVSDSENRNGSYIVSAHSHSSISTVDRHTPSAPLSAPPSTLAYPHMTSPPYNTQTLPTPSSSNVQNSPPNSYFSSGSPGSQLSVSPPANEALQQFLKAGIDLGLNQADLNEILARSQPKEQRGTDMTSGETLTRNNSLAARSLLGPQAEDDEAFRMASPVPEVVVEQAADIGRRPSRQYTGSPAPRRVREIAGAHATSGGAVVRRTIIFPSANASSTDLSTLLRKVSKRGKRVSGLSMQSNRSVHDRVPTPPPLKVKRLSTDTSPPVPTMPSWTGQSTLTAPRQFPEHNMEKSNSIYDFYDMYAGDRTGSSQAQEPFEPPRSPTTESMPETEPGQGIELIELDTGETIWQIVNGLRADDAESVFQHRVSFSSEFSGGAHDSDGEQLFFKEHTRNTSKSSSISGFARKKTASPALTRPETKVFYSSSAHIARLIDQLSRTTEAGTFDIKPKRPTGPGHSHSGSLQSDSDFGLPVEERLERMLDSINSNAN